MPLSTILLHWTVKYNRLVAGPIGDPKNTMNQKLLGSIGVLLISVLCIAILSKQAVVLSLVIVFCAYIKHKVFPIKKELLWYCLITIFGALAEMLLVNVGHAWTYVNPQLFGVPIYMPLFWGLLGTTIIVLYDGLLNL